MRPRGITRGNIGRSRSIAPPIASSFNEAAGYYPRKPDEEGRQQPIAPLKLQ